jgi:hypothetical protein
MGRDRGLPHGPGQGSNIPVVGTDYFFITTGVKKKQMSPKGVDELDMDEFVFSKEEIDGVEAARASGQVVKCILVRCSKSKMSSLMLSLSKVQTRSDTSPS